MSNTAKIPIPLREVACQNLITDDRNVIHHGNLRRRGMLNNLAEMVKVKQLKKLSRAFRWRQSYAVLHSGCLYIYDNEQSARASRATSLYGFTGVEPCRSEVSQEVSWPFKLICALQDRDREYFFSAPSEKDMKVWVKCIQEQILSIFKTTERAVQTAVVSPQRSEGRAGHSLPPPPPPHDAEYVLDEDDDDDEPGDYTEIDETEMDSFKKKNSDISNRSQPALPTDSKPRTAPRPFRPTPTEKVSPTPVAPRVTPRPPATSPATVSKSDSIDKGQWNDNSVSSKLEDNVEYFGAPQYLDLAEEADLEKRREGIPPEAYWSGRPEEADELMKKLSHNGAYMLRDSSEKGAQTLIVRVDSSVVKYKIQVNEKGHIGLMATGPHFESMSSLINFYKSGNIPRHNYPLTIPYSLVRKA